MAKGKLLVTDGMDGAGKKTHSRLLVRRLSNEGKMVKLVSFPNYHSDSSALVKRYLKGHFENNYGDDNYKFIKQVSAFYTVDRIATMIKKDLSTFKSIIDLLELGHIVVCDRYTTANILHMSAKLTDLNKIGPYINWIEDLEYEQFSLPRPDGVIYLDITPELAMKNMMKRYDNDESKTDINENVEHLNRVYAVKDKIVDYCKWTKIDCCEGQNQMLPIQVIHEKVYKEAMKIINK